MKDLHNLFKNIQEINPTQRLEVLILKKIEITKQKQIQQRVISAYVYMFGSVMLLIYSGIVFGKEILQSDFWSVASLFFSDLSVVLSNWQTFAYSLLETFPIVGVISISIPIFILLWSLALYSDWHGKIVQHIQAKKSFA